MKKIFTVLLAGLLLLIRIPLMICLWILSTVSGTIHEYSTLLLDWVDENIGGLNK